MTTSTTAAQNAPLATAAATWVALSSPNSNQNATLRSALKAWLCLANPVAVPHVQSASFTVPAGYGNDTLVGAITTDVPATSYAITAGDPNGYFAIYSSGNLRTNDNGIAVPAGSYSLSIAASNARGEGPDGAISG